MAFISLSDQPDYNFPPGTFDVRGWDVRTMADNEKIGKIDDILVDESGNPRYLDVDLGRFRKHVLLPIGQARVDEAEDVVLVPGMTKDQLKDVPEYDHNPDRITREYEDQVAAAYAGAYTGEHYYARPEYAGERPAVKGTGGEEAGRLAMLSELDDFDVADEDPDPRNWEVIASDRRAIGEVKDLVVDTSAMKVRYLDVDVNEEALGAAELRDRHILIPIGYARLDEDSDQVVVDAISSREVASLPPFEGLPLRRETEDRLHAVFTGGMAGGEERLRHPRYSAESFYEPRRRGLEEGEARMTRSEEELAIGKRDVRAGEVDVEKHVRTEHVRRPVTRQVEEVEVERRAARGRGEIREEELRVPVSEEELVVEKRPRVREELIVRKRPVEETEQIEADLRREEIEIERHGRVREMGTEEEEREREQRRRGRGRGEERERGGS
ncbi:MAG TPA: PRC-barrel domain-containing protein [Longimicrobiales bacterium]